MDVLGFGGRIIRDFQSALEQYEELIRNFRIFRGDDDTPGLTVRLFSDSILIVSEQVSEVLLTAQLMQCAALHSDCILRGGIATGKHLELSESNDLYVISEALVEASRLEKTILHPCVALHSNVEVPARHSELRVPSNLMRTVLYYEDRWIVNPFNVSWGYSAAGRAYWLRSEFLEHKEKYDWFLKLYVAVCSAKPLVP